MMPMPPRLGISRAEWQRIKAPHWPTYSLLNMMHWEDIDLSYRNDLKNRIIYIPSYHWSLVPILRHQFPGIENIKTTYSTQCDADILTLILLNGKKNGTYLELGAGVPGDSNNTLLLSQWGWKGISVEINDNVCKKWQTDRPNDKIIMADANGIDYHLLLKTQALPKTIDLLQIDIDDARMHEKLLPRLPLDQYRFSLITVEHDKYQTGVATKHACDKFFTDHGYIKLFNNLVYRNWAIDDWSEFEDWWIWPDHFPHQLIDDFETASDSKTWSFERLCISGSLDEIDQAKCAKNIWPQKAERI